MAKQSKPEENRKLFIPKGQIIWVKVNFEKPVRKEVPGLIKFEQDHFDSDGNYRGIGHVGVVLDEDLYLILLEGKPSRAQDCRCFIPLIGEEYFSSINAAQKKLLQTFTPSTHDTRSIYENCFVAEETGFRALREVRSQVDPESDEVKNIRKLLTNLGKQGQLAVIKQLMGLIYKNTHEDNSITAELVAFLSERKELVLELIRNSLTKEDLVATAYRKEQLSVFKGLLTDDMYFADFQNKERIDKTEAVWQYFFQKNTWIFGYGLGYVFMSPLDDGRLEKVTEGFSILGHGKRIDALLKTRGIISSLCFVELKTHKTPLLAQVVNSYRPDSWSISSELAGGLAQVQKTVQKALKSITSKYLAVDKIGNQTGETAYLYQPRSILVIGSLNEFRTAHGVNEEKYSSFELFRQHIVNPEIITFDELYERSTHIVSTLSDQTE